MNNQLSNSTDEEFLDLLTPDLQNRINELRQGQQTETITNPKQNYWPWIIGSLSISCLAIGLMLWVINQKIKLLLSALIFLPRGKKKTVI